MAHKKYEFLADDPNANVKPIIVSLVIGAFFAILNETLLNIALTTLMKEFSITVTEAQWMATGFMLMMGIVIPASAVLLQWFTTRQLFLATMTIFTLGTTICAIAPTFSILIAGRFLQAIGTGLLVPIIFNTFLLIYPPHRRGAVMGVIGFVIMFAPAIGPTLSGIIVQYLGWRFLFITVIPFSLFSIVFAYKYLVNVSEVTKPKIDFISLFLSTLGFGGVVFGFSSAGEKEASFLDPVVFSSIIIGVISLAIFCWRQLRLKDPMIDIRVFRYPMFSFGVVAFFIIIMIMFASEIILPIYMQGPLGLAASTAGLILLPGSLLNGLLSPLMGHLFDQYGPKRLMLPGSIFMVITMFVFSRLDLNTSPIVIIIAYIVLMVSVSAMLMPAETNGLNQLPKHLYPHGTAVVSTFQPVAGAIGVSAFISIMNARQASVLQSLPDRNDPLAIAQAHVSGIEFVYFIGLFFALIVFVMSFFVYRAKPINYDS